MRANIMASFQDVNSVDFPCPWTGDGAQGRSPVVSQRIRVMAWAELVVEAAKYEQDDRIKRLIDYVESGKVDAAKCPGCSLSQTAATIRLWLAGEESQHGA